MVPQVLLDLQVRMVQMALTAPQALLDLQVLTVPQVLLDLMTKTSLQLH
tara:strand:- start:255 stop:401 length:147 start_codon:yes stop_codon:yes gene_type:complete